MKKLLTAIFALALLVIVFNSCKKDDEAASENSITIEGTFTIGEKTFTNPTFDLGTPTAHEGYRRPNYKKSVVPSYMIKIEPLEDFDLGNNIYLGYDYYIYADVVGVAESSVDIELYSGLAKEYFELYSENITTTVTTIDAVGGYIVGTYEGDFYLDKKVETTYHVKGKFKVKRTADEIPQ